MSPVEPFERIDPQMGFYRPLVYSFAHRIMPAALFSADVLLTDYLRDTPAGGGDLSHLWSRSAMQCEVEGLWPEGLVEDARFIDYLGGFVESAEIDPVPVDGGMIWAVTFPEPVDSPEAYFAAITYAGFDAAAPAAAPRYFLLEKMSDTDGAGAVCEWKASGEHVFHGTTPEPVIENFLGIVYRLSAK